MIWVISGILDMDLFCITNLMLSKLKLNDDSKKMFSTENPYTAAVRYDKLRSNGHYNRAR
jgi:hypothetical protein